MTEPVKESADQVEYTEADYTVQVEDDDPEQHAGADVSEDSA